MVTRLVILMVSLLGYLLNGVSLYIDLSLSFTNLIAPSAFGTCESAAHVSRLTYIEVFKTSSQKVTVGMTLLSALLTFL